MRKKLCYVIAADAPSMHSSMLFVSAAAAKRIHPELHIVVLCDSVTRSVLEGYDQKHLKVFDEVLVCDVESDNVVMRSRELKIRSRTVIDGPYLFLDADTLPVRPFDAIFDYEPDMVVTRDYQWDKPYTGLPAGRVKAALSLGWPIDMESYFNGGVFMMHDTPATREFSREWYRRWREFILATGKALDQIAYNVAIQTCPLKITVAPARFNAMVKSYIELGNNAAIVHFFGGIGDASSNEGLLLTTLVDQFERDGNIDWALVSSSVQKDHYYVTSSARHREWMRHGWRFLLHEGRRGSARKAALNGLIEAPLSSEGWILLIKSIF